MGALLDLARRAVANPAPPGPAPCRPLHAWSADLARLVPQVCKAYRCTRAEIEEALTCAAGDLEAARESFTAMARELGLDKPPPDPVPFLTATQYLRLGEALERPKLDRSTRKVGP